LIKISTYFPYPIKVWLNGHEWAKRQATQAGIEFTELSNGFATCADPAALQAICDRLGPGTIGVFFERWMSRLPLPLTEADRAAGYWWELSMRQVEVSRTLVFDAPRCVSSGPTTSPPVPQQAVGQPRAGPFMDGERAMQWITDRFNGMPSTPNCGQILIRIKEPADSCPARALR
jgi:hypothetical protein